MMIYGGDTFNLIKIKVKKLRLVARVSVNVCVCMYVTHFVMKIDRWH